MPRGHHKTDRPGVDVTEDMTANFLITRADVAARAAADAPKRVAREWIVAHRGPAVVEEHKVQLLRAVDADLRLELDVRGARRPRDELRVRGDLLARPAAREELHDRDRVIEGGDELLDSDDRDMDGGQGRREI